MSGWAILWRFVPFMNLWMIWRMFACPPGYETHRTLDVSGKVIGGIRVGLVLLGMLGPIFDA